MRSSLLLLCVLARAALADVSIDGRVLSERAQQAVIYATDLPAQSAPEGTRARMKQVHLKFTPQVLPVQQGTTVEFVNSDEVAHNVFSPTADDSFDLGAFGVGTRTHLFKEPGQHVVLCNVHVEMVAWVLVLKNAAFAAVERDGSFRLRLPPGHHRLVLWRPREPELVREVEVPASGPMSLDWSIP